MTRTAVRGLGELFITAGLVVLLFVAYQLVWTNYEAHRAADQVADDIRDGWTRPPLGTTGPAATPVATGKGFAFLHIPRLGNRWSVPVVEGVVQVLPRRLDFTKVDDPAEVLLERSCDLHSDPVRVPVQARALVLGRQVRQAVGGLEGELLGEFHDHRIPRYLWVCMLKLQCGCSRQYSTVAAVFSVMSGPSIG